MEVARGASWRSRLELRLELKEQKHSGDYRTGSTNERGWDGLPGRSIWRLLMWVESFRKSWLVSRIVRNPDLRSPCANQDCKAEVPKRLQSPGGPVGAKNHSSRAHACPAIRVIKTESASCVHHQGQSPQASLLEASLHTSFPAGCCGFLQSGYYSPHSS